MAAPDLLTTEVIAHRLHSTAEEMLATLVKTAYSPNIKERRDCSTAIFNAGGDALALGISSPIHFGSMLGMVGNLTRRYPLHELRPGDVFLTNDPYIGGGSHLPDLTATSPVFHENRLVGFVASLAHHSDIGGKVAGSESADCTSIFQEGLRIPPVRLARGGVLCEDVLEFILINSRTPGERTGDIKAQLAANAVGARRVQETFDRFGADSVHAAAAALLDYSEARTRAAIARMPDGRYENELFLDHDGVGEAAVRLKVTVAIAGDGIEFDFAGTDPQVAGARNCVLNATEASVYQVVKVVADPGLPPNAGYFRAIEVRAPPGSVLNCRPPAAVGDRSPTTNMLGDLLHGALFEAVPERVMAGCGPRQGIIFSGVDHRRSEYFVDYEIFAGGSGALFDHDGKDAVRVHATIANSTPAEATEQEFPLIVRRSELVPDSGGAGKFRGGLAMRTDIAMWGAEPKVSGRGMRQTMPAEGLNGGGSGAPGRFLLHPRGDEERGLPGVFSELAVASGTTIRVETPGGAGYGDPLERDPALVLADVRAGKVSPDAAKEHYAVVLDEGRIDPARTEGLRRLTRERRPPGRPAG